MQPLTADIKIENERFHCFFLPKNHGLILLPVQQCHAIVARKSPRKDQK